MIGDGHLGEMAGVGRAARGGEDKHRQGLVILIFILSLLALFFVSTSNCMCALQSRLGRRNLGSSNTTIVSTLEYG